MKRSKFYGKRTAKWAVSRTTGNGIVHADQAALFARLF
jgi:hypothetical protein